MIAGPTAGPAIAPKSSQYDLVIHDLVPLGLPICHKNLNKYDSQIHLPGGLFFLNYFLATWYCLSFIFMFLLCELPVTSVTSKIDNTIQILSLTRLMNPQP